MQSDELTKQIQEIELGLLRQFQEICNRHNLRYFAIGGTCIGAVRHKGFIPWDDDIDVAMPAEDYFSFIEYAKLELKNTYTIMSDTDSRYYHIQYIRLQNANTTFIQSYTVPHPDRWGGVFMDIMPVTGLPVDLTEQRKYIKRFSWYKRLNFFQRMDYKFGNKSII